MNGFLYFSGKLDCWGDRMKAANVNVLYQRAYGKAVVISEQHQNDDQRVHPAMLSDILKTRKVLKMQDLGTLSIPLNLIVGVHDNAEEAMLYTNSLYPMAEPDAEAADCWKEACRRYLAQGDDGCPIECYEHLGLFYVKTGMEMASVMKYHEAQTIKAHVVRVYTSPDSQDDRSYADFLMHFELTGLYQIRLNQPQYFMKLQEAMGNKPREHWTDDDRKYFLKIWSAIEKAFQRAYEGTFDLTAADALCVLLEKYPLDLIAQIEPWILPKMFLIFWKELSLLNQSGRPQTGTDLKTVPAY